MIPLVDLKAQYDSIRREIDAAIAGVIDSTGFIGGDEVRAFNEEFGAFCGAHAVGVGSGTDALYLSARALGIGPGDQVIVPSHTFVATAEAITLTGADVVFADIDSATYNLDPSDVEAKITDRTRAIVAVHLYGQPTDMDALRLLADRHDLLLIEDAAQAHGARIGERPVGTLGDVAAFSFYPGKNLGAYGDAGAVVSRDANIVERVAMLSDHGRADKYMHRFEGVSSRLDAIQAAILRVKLRHLNRWNRRRVEIAGLYNELLAEYPEVRLPAIQKSRSHVYHLYVVDVDDRDALQSHLRSKGVATGIHYPVPLHLQPAYAHLGYARGSLPRTETAADRILSLPIYPELTDSQVSEIVDDVVSFVTSRPGPVRTA